MHHIDAVQEPASELRDIDVSGRCEKSLNGNRLLDRIVFHTILMVFHATCVVCQSSYLEFIRPLVDLYLKLRT